jgi:hypothetical protein
MKAFCAILIAFTASAAAAEPARTVAEFEWPAETSTYKPGNGVELAQALCLNCHSSDYVSSQPPMPLKFWEGVIKKMKEKYAAPLPDDVTVLADYLTREYGVK